MAARCPNGCDLQCKNKILTQCKLNKNHVGRCQFSCKALVERRRRIRRANDRLLYNRLQGII